MPQQIPRFWSTALSDPHPTYSNPTIVQVTCEIAFAATSDDRLSLGTLYPIFSPEFPEMTPIGAGTIQFVIGQPLFAPHAPEPQNPTAVFRFSAVSGLRFVQLSKTNFVYQSSEPYIGWADFRSNLLRLWQLSVPHLKPGSIAKVGLRYINRIPKSDASQGVGDWLVATDDIPDALLRSKEHFLGRIESSPAHGHLRLVTIANEVPGPTVPDGAIIMDVDRLSTEQFEPNTNLIFEKLELLHEDVWVTFNAATSDALRKHLSGEKQ
jgi:uncharacterized protein (TIGR04255 family)